MFKKATFFGTLAGLGFLLGAISGAIAAETHPNEHATTPSTGFQRIEQPLANKVAVTLGGLGLIGLELWWFLLSKPKSRQAITSGGIQEVTVTVDGGYEPSFIVVQAGQPVRLNFQRLDPSSCLEEVRFPDFHIAQTLLLNQTTAIEFTPEKPGKYEFTCGMNMFRGVVEVQASDPAASANVPATLTPQSSHQKDNSIPSVSSIEANVTKQGFQEATIAVEKGYQPQRVIVEVGQPVRLHFQRKNSSKCYDQLLIPNFNVTVDLIPDQTTTVEFTPQQPGEYEFMCGMKMNRGVIEVRASKTFRQYTQASLVNYE